MGQVPCGLGAIELPMFAFPRLDAIPDLFGGLRVPEEVAVFGLDDAFLDEEVEVDRLSPISLADKNDRDRSILRVWLSVRTSKSSSSVPKPPGKATSAIARCRKCSST